VKFEDVADAIMYCYNTPETLRNEMGYAGREWALSNGLTSEQMGNKMIEMMNYLFNVQKETRPTFSLHKFKEVKYNKPGIVC